MWWSAPKCPCLIAICILIAMFLSIDSPWHMRGEVTFDIYLCGAARRLAVLLHLAWCWDHLEGEDLNQHHVPRETKQMVLILTNCCNASGPPPSGSFINWHIMRQWVKASLIFYGTNSMICVASVSPTKHTHADTQASTDTTPAEVWAWLAGDIGRGYKWPIAEPFPAGT